MSRRILIPHEPQPGIARGAALIEMPGARALLYHDRRLGFADHCAKACSQGRPITVDFPVHRAGYFDEQLGMVRITGRRLLSEWLGRRAGHRDIWAQDHLNERRSQARRLAIQGRKNEAFKLDRRLGF